MPEKDRISASGKAFFPWWKESPTVIKFLLIFGAIVVLSVAMLAYALYPKKSEPLNSQQTLKTTGDNSPANAIGGSLNVGPGGIGTIGQSGGTNIINNGPIQRTIGSEQIEMLRHFRGDFTSHNFTIPVKIFIQDANLEAAKYAAKIAEALKSLGITAIYTQSNGSWLLPEGLSICDSQDPAVGAEIDTIKEHFKQIGVEIRATPHDYPPGTQSLITIFVGSQ